MENIISRLQTTMADYNLSFNNLNMLRFNMREGEKQLGQLFDRTLFSKSSYSEMISCNKQQKHSLYKDVFQIDFCPFEKLTGMDWEKMFDIAYVIHPEIKTNFRFVSNWFHLLVSSAFFNKDKGILYKGSKGPIYMDFYHPGLKELVLINGKKYIYGEAGLTVDIGYKFEESFLVRFTHPVIVFDQRIIHSILKQNFHEKVLEIIQFLYVISSHDGLIHSSFAEGNEPLQTELEKEEGLLRLLWEGGNYFTCFTCELNYVRMMRSVFDLVTENNQTIREDVSFQFWLLELLTENWDPVCRSYVRYMAHERIERLMIYKTKKEDFHRKFIKTKTKDGKSMLYPPGEYLEWFTHSHRDREAMVHANGRNSKKMGFVSWKQMTDSMFNAYSRINPFLNKTM